jgi:hypothetical protein
MMTVAWPDQERPRPILGRPPPDTLGREDAVDWTGTNKKLGKTDRIHEYIISSSIVKTQAIEPHHYPSSRRRAPMTL